MKATFAEKLVVFQKKPGCAIFTDVLRLYLECSSGYGVICATHMINSFKTLQVIGCGIAMYNKLVRSLSLSLLLLILLAYYYDY